MRRRVVEIVELLRKKPYIGKPLRGPLRGKWCIRIGKYRVIYEVDEENKIVFLLTIGPRRKIYKRLLDPANPIS